MAGVKNVGGARSIAAQPVDAPAMIMLIPVASMVQELDVDRGRNADLGLSRLRYDGYGLLQWRRHAPNWDRRERR